LALNAAPFLHSFSGGRKAIQHEAGNDFRLADWRMDLLEELFAESENALGLHCPAAVVIVPIHWRRHGETKYIDKLFTTHYLSVAYEQTALFKR
jgi:hypothetical protein